MPFKTGKAVQEQDGDEKPILHLAKTCINTFFIGMLYDRIVVI